MDNLNPNLIGESFSLTPLTSDILGVLHRWESDIRYLHLWTVRKKILSDIEFREYMLNSLKEFIHVFLIIRNKKGEPLGFIYSYDCNFADGYLFVTIFLDPHYRNLGIGVRANLLFFHYIFSYFGSIRKIYCDVLEYNGPSLNILKKSGFNIEGRFKAHRFYCGHYTDLFRLSIFREDFYELHYKLLKRVICK